MAILLLQLVLADEVADLLVDLPVDLNDNFGFLLLELIQADHLADLPPSRGIQWPRMAILDFYC